MVFHSVRFGVTLGIGEEVHGIGKCRGMELKHYGIYVVGICCP